MGQRNLPSGCRKPRCDASSFTAASISCMFQQNPSFGSYCAICIILFPGTPTAKYDITWGTRFEITTHFRRIPGKAAVSMARRPTCVPTLATHLLDCRPTGVTHPLQQLRQDRVLQKEFCTRGQRHIDFPAVAQSSLPSIFESCGATDRMRA